MIDKFKMIKVVTLGFDSAIDAIEKEKTVFCRSGVWNVYSLVAVDYAIQRIKNSGYGADIYFNEENEKYYVSIPSSGDMW